MTSHHTTPHLTPITCVHVLVLKGEGALAAHQVPLEAALVAPAVRPLEAALAVLAALPP